MPPKKKDQETEDLKNEIQFLKSSFNDMNHRMMQMKEQLDKVSVIFDYHSHPRTEMTGKPIFMQQEFEEDMRKRQEEQQQQQPPQPVVEPRPEPEEE